MRVWIIDADLLAQSILEPFANRWPRWICDEGAGAGDEVLRWVSVEAGCRVRMGCGSDGGVSGGQGLNGVYGRMGCGSDEWC